MKLRRALRVAVGASAALWSSGAGAQTLPCKPLVHYDFGQQDQFVVSVERLFGLVSSTRDQGGETKSYVSLALFARPNTAQVASYSAPRVAFDYFPVAGFSLGAGLGLEAVASGDENAVGAVVFAPRLGYAVGFSPHAGIWPRVGITCESSDDEQPSLFALTLDAPLVITPTSHAAITIGPALDLGLNGSRGDAGNFTEKETDIGLHAGLLIYL
jgi:hypothetical protein